MRFTLTPTFTEADLQRKIDDFLDRFVRIFLNELNQIGLEVVRDARLRTKYQGGFGDITGNLRSSIGYLIGYDGNIVSEDFEKSDNGNDGTTGLAEGKSFAESLIDENAKGWQIIWVAGMEYASAVEARGINVITASTLKLKNKLSVAFENINKLEFVI